VVQILAAQAPTWLVQFPGLLKQEHLQTLRREILGATRECMLREIGEAVEAITAAAPLLLVLRICNGWMPRPSISSRRWRAAAGRPD